MILAWAMAGMFALAPMSGEPEGAVSSAESSPGRLVFLPDHRGSITVEDARGQTIATVALGRRVVVELPPGRYLVRDPEGHEIDTIEVKPGQAHGVELPEAWRTPESEPPNPPQADPTPVPSAVTTGRLGAPPPDALAGVELVRPRRWTRWAAPLLSAVVPGGGQALNGQPGRGLAVFTGTVGMVLGTLAVGAARDPTQGATPGDSGGGDAREVVRLVGLAGLSSAAGLLYLGQILDAHAQATGHRARPLSRHRLAFEVSRFTTVGFSAGQPAYALYSDWSLAIMGQVVPRVTLGLSDASIKYSRHRGMVTVQAGARAAYRFFERRRIWLAAGGGWLLQGTHARASAPPVVEDPDAPAVDAERAFSAVPYVHFDARLFLLDRWSLGLMPRVSLPLVARRFRGAAALPRYATTFELGANMGVYF